MPKVIVSGTDSLSNKIFTVFIFFSPYLDLFRLTYSHKF